MKHSLLLFSLFASATLWAEDVAPVVKITGLQQNPATRVVTVTYNIDKPAIVTMDVLTNGVSIGGANIQCVSGDCFKRIVSGDNHVVTWNPTVSWPDQTVPAGALSVRLTAWSAAAPPNYMVVDVSGNARANSEMYYPSAEFVPGGVTNAIYKTTKLLLRKIPAKGVTWQMGSDDKETVRDAERENLHAVTLPADYYLGVYEITQAQWGEIVNNTWTNKPSFFTQESALRPVEQVNFNMLRVSSATGVPTAEPGDDSFLGQLRAKTGIAFDLPSEAQWEFAARGGYGSGFWNDGSTIQNTNPDENLDRLGRYLGNCKDTNHDGYFLSPKIGGTALVGSYPPNDFGLFDMHGNVYEWCLDWFEADFTSYIGAVNINSADPAKTLSGNAGATRVLRGGCWSDRAPYCRPAYRNALNPGAIPYRCYGCRVAVAVIGD